MNVGNWLTLTTKKLEAVGIGTARLDALVLLEDVTGIDRARLLAEPDMEIGTKKLAKLTNLLKRRARHEPLAHIRGRVEFYGRDFLLTHDILVPRPESETMIDLLKTLPIFERKTGVQAKRTIRPVSIVDIGTGSGALGITAALELPNTLVDLLDIDKKALKVAKTNVDKFTLNLRFVQGDLLADVNNGYDVILANLPYVPDDFKINQAAMREPRRAIFGGLDGLDVYRRLFDQLKNRPSKPLYILCEALPPQHSKLAGIARQAGYNTARKDGFIQVFSTE